IREEVLADKVQRKLDCLRVIKSATRDRTIHTRVCVKEDRIREARVGRTAGTFADGPTIIRTRDTVVDLFPGALTDIVDEHTTRAGLECERKRIAQTERPDRTIVSSRLIEKRVVSRNSAGRCDAQHFAEYG